jgi:hypothetical protein
MKPGLNPLYYFIVGALDGEVSSHLKGSRVNEKGLET